MSQTFFIKNTAFDDNSNNIQIREDNSFIIGPGELNGPGGVNRESDLELYGFGSIKWGEGVDQNQYRLLESHACLAKETGDFLPGTDVDDATWVHGSGSYVVGVSPLLPKDERDLGLGNGITAPLVGQLWYNLTDQKMYNYDLSYQLPPPPSGSPVFPPETLVWKTVYAEATNSVSFHELRTDLHLTPLQNTFLDGLNLPSVTSSEVNTLDGINLFLGGGTVQGQLDLMVEKAGDTMTGSLIMQSDIRMDIGNITLDGGSELWFESGQHRITNNDGGGNFNIRVGNEYNAGTLYTQTGGAIHVLMNHESTNPELSILLGDGFVNTIGQPVTFSGLFDFTNDGNISVNAIVHPNDQHLITKLYADNRYVNVAGDFMTGTLNLNTNDALTFENGDHRITYNDGAGNFNIRVGNEYDVGSTSTIYTDNAGAIHLEASHQTTTPSFIIRVSDGVHAIGNVVNFSGNFTFGKTGNLTLSGTGSEVLGLPATPSGNTAATSKAYVDTKAPINSPTLTGDPRSVTFASTDNSTRIATTAFVKSNVSSVGVTYLDNGGSGSVTIPSGITRATITMVSGGGGGASGGDGGNWIGDDGGTGGTTTVIVTGNGTYSLPGGSGGRGNAGTGQTLRAVPIGGYGISFGGTAGGPAANTGLPTRGGNGGSTPNGYGGIGSSAFGTWGGDGQVGGGGGGGVGQDALPGEGGNSGRSMTRTFSVSAGQVITYTLGSGGARGTNPFTSDRYGGLGGTGHISIVWG